MKNNRLFQIFISLFILTILVTFASCADLNTNENIISPTGEIQLTKAQQQILESDNAFSINLFRKFYDKTEGNLLLSPISTSISLAMLSNGTDRAAYNEIAKVIGHPGVSLDEVNKYYGLFISALDKVDSKVTYRSNNSFWYDKNKRLVPEYGKILKNYYHSTLYAVDFTNEATLERINKWGNDATDGLIPEVLKDINPSTQFAVMNATLFRAPWAVPPSSSSKGLFYGIENEIKEVNYMKWVGNMSHSIDDFATLFSLSYGDKGAFSFVVIVPHSDFDDFVEDLTPDKFKKLTNSLYGGYVALSFPQFTSSFEADDILIDILEEMGIERAFKPFTKYYGILSDYSSGNWESRHKTSITVDMKGTFAAGFNSFSSVRLAGLDNKPVPIIVNKPFIYAIRENSTNAILFIGAFVN